MNNLKIILIVFIFFYILLLLQPIFKKTYLPKKTLNYNDNINTILGIPKIIFRTWHTKKVSQKLYNNAHLPWLKMNNDYQMYWYDLDECKLFLEFFDKTYKTNALENWQNVKPLAFKADIWRLCIIYHYGGVYVDATSKCMVKLDKIISECYGDVNLKDKLIIATEPYNMGMHNGFIIATPKNPIIKKYLDDILYNISSKNMKLHPHTLCGPLQFQKTIDSLFMKKSKLGLNKNGNLNYYMIKLNYSINGGDIVKDNKRLLIKKYDILDCVILKKILNFKNDYLILSLTGKIFEKFFN